MLGLSLSFGRTFFKAQEATKVTPLIRVSANPDLPGVNLFSMVYVENGIQLEQVIPHPWMLPPSRQS